MHFSKRKKALTRRVWGCDFDSKWRRSDPWAAICGVQWKVAQWSCL